MSCCCGAQQNIKPERPGRYWYRDQRQTTTTTGLEQQKACLPTPHFGRSRSTPRSPQESTQSLHCWLLTSGEALHRCCLAALRAQDAASLMRSCAPGLPQASAQARGAAVAPTAMRREVTAELRRAQPQAASTAARLRAHPLAEAALPSSARWRSAARPWTRPCWPACWGRRWSRLTLPAIMGCQRPRTGQ